MACESKTLGSFAINRLLTLLKSRKYKVFTKPYMLNIIGVRNADTDPNKFDDYIYVIWRDDKGKLNGKRYNATTDPSTRYLKQGGHKKGSNTGTAILPQGQYLDKWHIRGHGQTGYKALGQYRSGDDKKICVYRDYDRNSTLNFDVKTKTCGHYGINIHRAKAGGADDGRGNTNTIGVYSAGCQVFQNYYCFQEFMDMAYKQESLYGGSFSYTLIDKSLEKKFRIKRAVYTTSVVAALTLVGYGLYLLNKNK